MEFFSAAANNGIVAFADLSGLANKRVKVEDSSFQGHDAA
jgi:hypothetical protein